MSRSIPANFSDAIEQPITTPIYLFAIDVEFYLCSFDVPAKIANKTWMPTNMQVMGPDQRSGGTLQAEISIPYNVTGLMERVLTNRYVDKKVQLSTTYYRSTGYTEPVLLLDGYIDDFHLSEVSADGVPKIIFNVSTSSARSGVTPNIRIGPPLLNHITPKGTIITWNGQTIGIDR